LDLGRAISPKASVDFKANCFGDSKFMEDVYSKLIVRGKWNGDLNIIEVQGTAKEGSFSRASLIKFGCGRNWTRELLEVSGF
jgi:ribonuclease PH